MSTTILGRLDEMADRVNQMEQTMDALIEKTGVEIPKQEEEKAEKKDEK